jgi:hypothetical protein
VLQVSRGTAQHTERKLRNSNIEILNPKQLKNSNIKIQNRFENLSLEI